MKYQYFMPTRLVFGRNCVQENADRLAAFGSRAFILTGRHSAKACGALDDVTAALESRNVAYQVFNEIESNPSLETVVKASAAAKAFGAAFVIGIGGGSPLDAAKAVAALTANDMQPEDLFKNRFLKRPLPIVGVPTTAGTGSEATPYSVILRRDLQTKVSFGTPETFPALALLDSRYTAQLPRTVTVDTAVDAFTHSLEGYLARRSTAFSNALALEGIRLFGEVLPSLLAFEIDDAARDKLLHASTIGGVVIAQAGVTIAHGMGYCYTFFKNTPHGRANGFLMREYLKFNQPAAAEKIDTALKLLGMADINAFGDVLERLIGKAPALTADEVDSFTERTLLQKGSIANNARELSTEDIRQLWKNNA